MRIIAASQNTHKIKEIDAITSRFGMKLCSMKDAGLADIDIEENGSTFEENSFIKADAILKLTGEASLADDTGLCIDALDGAPGIYSARFSGEHGNDQANRSKVLGLMKDVPFEKRTARFICVITLLLPDGRKIVAKGICEGMILTEERGELGFGYDSIFAPLPGDLSFAEISADEKNRISHRAKALEILASECERARIGAGQGDEKPGYMKSFEYWKSCPAIDEKDRAELAALTDEADIKERFSSELEFGTGGLRGVLGLGSSRMNKYNVRKATAGLAAFLCGKYGEAAKARGMAIAYDSRHCSKEFALEAALTAASFGMKVFLFDRVSATPLLSFTVRRLGCAGGVVITASHNTKEYNGYKAYDETGCQLSDGDSARVLEEASKYALGDIRPMEREAARKADLLEMLGADDIKAFTDRIRLEAGPVSAEAKSGLRIVYTPLHGVGYAFVSKVLGEEGFTSLYTVEEQKLPDPDFPTVVFPNPEIPESLKLALELAEEKQADIIIATDPDSDRTGFGARDRNGRMVLFSGNQIGTLMLDYLIKKRKTAERSTVVTTLVTGEMGPALARKRGLDVKLTLTGFKNIGGIVNRMEDPSEFLFGYEESFGYLASDHVREKDGVLGSFVLCQMAAEYKALGKTVPEVFEELCKELGYFTDKSTSYTLTGAGGAAKIKAISAKIRALGKDLMPGIASIEDYSKGQNGIQPAELMRFIFEDGSWIASRPSGTEPKIKFYYSIKSASFEEGEKLFKEKKAVIDSLVESI